MPYLAGRRPSQVPDQSPVYLSELSARDKSWDRLKQQSLFTACLYAQLDYDRYALRMGDCSPVLRFQTQVDPETGVISLKLHDAFFCRVRHCPICQSRRSKMWVARILKALPLVEQDHPTARFIFLTLTVRNCPVEELRETISQMNKSWQRLSQRSGFPAIGLVKALEVTRSVTGEAHPHFHALLLVPSSYFGGKYYIPHAEWVKRWRDCLRADYDPSVRVKAVRPWKGNSDKRGGLAAAVVETLKYSVKPEDMTADPAWLDLLTQQMHNLKSVSVGGVLKKYISEEDPEDLIGVDDEWDEESRGTVAFGYHESSRRYRRMG